MTRFASACTIGCMVTALATLAGCQERPDTTLPNSTDVAANAPAQRYVTATVSAEKKASLTLGDEYIEFDSITCIGTTMATAVAADRASREEYPTVTLKTFDPSMTGGMDSNTASIQFRGTARNELWTLHDGSVSHDGDVFQASGTVQGKQMVTQPDGTLKSQPVEDVSEQPFDVSITCR